MLGQRPRRWYNCDHVLNKDVWFFSSVLNLFSQKRQSVKILGVRQTDVYKGNNPSIFFLHVLLAGPESGCGFESRPGRKFVIGVVHIVLQTVQRYGVCSAVHGTVHYKEPYSFPASWITAWPKVSNINVLAFLQSIMQARDADPTLN